MVKISALKIRKGIYKFEVRKRYQFVQRFRAVVKPPIEKIKDSLRSLLVPKKVEEKKEAPSAEAPPGGFNLALIGGAVALAILILLVGFVWWQINVAQPAPAPFKPVEKSSVSNSILSSSVMTAGSRGTTDHVCAVFVDYNTTSLQNYSINLKTYPDDLPTEFFILTSDVLVEATVYPDFLRNLRKEFDKKGLVLNEISLDQLGTVPKGAAVIVPTGVAPSEMLEGRGNVSRFLEEEVVVIYIGQSFKSMLKGGLVTTTPQTILNALPASFDETSPPSCSGLTLFQPLYSASGSGGISSSRIYGCVSVLKKGSGAFVFVPQTIDGGWRSDPKAAAKDILKIAVETRWTSPDDATGSSYFLTADNKTKEITGKKLLFSNSYQGDNRTVKIHFSGYSTTGLLLEDIQIVKAKKVQRGELYVSQLTVTSTNVTDEKIRMNAKLSEPTPSTPLMYLVFTDGKGSEVARELQGNINTQSERNLDVPIYLDKGEYTVALEDDESRLYASTYLKVTSVSITGPRQGARSYIYIFDISTPVTLKTLSVDIDNGAFKKDYSGVSAGELSIDVSSQTGGDALSYGNHTFEFTAGGLKKAVSYNRPLPPPPFPPELLFVTLLAGIILAVGVYFARQEKVFYALDVPDFPPVSRTKIPLSTDVVLSVFEKVNENYRWEFTPLTVAEVKNGFRDIYHKGKPIYISDYNTEYLLNELVRGKNVGTFLDYYGLNLWEKKSTHTIRYLAMLRKLRDICVNNAVPFTSLGESKACDSEITVVGQQMFLHFYDAQRLNEIIKSSLITLGKGITIVLFRDEPEKQEFSSILNSPTDASTVLKVEVENSSVLLLTYPELEKMVQEFKGV